MLHDPQRLLLIAGPCALENERVCRGVAEALVALARAQPDLQIVFKGSYDKANRTSGGSPRGPGLDTGLGLLGMVKRDYGLPVLTDVHEPGQVPAAAGSDLPQLAVRAVLDEEQRQALAQDLASDVG